MARATGGRLRFAVVALSVEPAWTRGARSCRGISLLVVGEQMGEDGKTPPLLPGCKWWYGLYAGVRGVRGGDGERFPGRRIEGRNRRSRSRRGGVRGPPPLVAEFVADISGVGELDGGTCCVSRRCVRRDRCGDVFRRFLL